MGRSGWGCNGRRVGGDEGCNGRRVGRDEGKWRKRLKKA